METTQENKQCDIDSIDNRLDVVLVTALRENFEIKEGFHMDRNEMLQFLRSVVKQHSDLEFVLHHRDTKLSGRIYKAFPKVTTKRVAVPNERGKKIWRYTNLRKILKETDPEQKLVSNNICDADEMIMETKEDETEDSTFTYSHKEQVKKEHAKTNNDGDNGSNSFTDCSDNSSFESLTRSSNQAVDNTKDLNFSAMLKWIKEKFVLDKNSSVQVKCIVDGIKAAFNTDITYKQSHKLVFSVFPGASSRVVNPVRLEVRGSFYSYRGIAPKCKQGKTAEAPVVPRVKTSKSKSRRYRSAKQSVKSVCTKQTWIPPCGLAETGKPRVKQTRKRFLQSCAVLKDNLDALESMRSYDGFPAAPDFTAMERENYWRRMVEELKQERDQAIVERNQAMVSLMELEREQHTESQRNNEIPRHQTMCHDGGSNAAEIRPKSEETSYESRDWLQSLINRSNHILGEQMSEANSKYFPGLTLQNSSTARPIKQPRYSGDFIEMERFEKLKVERDQIWKSWMEKLKREKEDIIQQLKLEKMEVIQKMELEKSDAIDCVQEKLSNQIMILTRELRELKELLNHTMNERTLAIEHAQKLMKLIDGKTLKEESLDVFPFDLMENHLVHRPRQRSIDESENQNFPLSVSKGSKRKQSMPAKLKKIPKTYNSPECSEAQKSTEETGKESEKYCAETGKESEKSYAETGKEFEEYTETGKESEKYFTGTGNQVVSCCNDQDVSECSKVSSIDCLNSIVEKIGKHSIGTTSPKKYSPKTDDLCPIE